jgi:hypothetical protein
LIRISLYLDEHVQKSLAKALRARGVDVLTTQDAGNMGLGDSEQVVFVAEQQRSLLTYNKTDCHYFSGIGIECKPQIKQNNPSKLRESYISK